MVLFTADSHEQESGIKRYRDLLHLMSDRPKH
jgi:hypothetical protein